MKNGGIACVEYYVYDCHRQKKLRGVWGFGFDDKLLGKVPHEKTETLAFTVWT